MDIIRVPKPQGSCAAAGWGTPSPPSGGMPSWRHLHKTLVGLRARGNPQPPRHCRGTRRKGLEVRLGTSTEYALGAGPRGYRGSGWQLGGGRRRGSVEVIEQAWVHWAGAGSPRYRSTASRGFRTACFSTSGLCEASGSRAVPVRGHGEAGQAGSRGQRSLGGRPPALPRAERRAGGCAHTRP